MDDLTFFATAARDVEPLLTDELRAFAEVAAVPDAAVKEERGGVSFAGPLALAYRACLWSRVAQRVLLPLASFAAPDPDTLYAGVATIDWDEHLSSQSTLAVDVVSVKSQVTHTQFASQKVKDAIVDQFRERSGERPSVDLARPDLRLNVFLQHDQATVSIDLSSDSLHRRGYRTPGEQVAAPLKETLAAAILLRAGWAALAAQGGSVVDPLCGSATLPIEAALIAADVAPGLTREFWGFLAWKGHDAAVWQELIEEAGGRRSAALSRLTRAAALPLAFGYDNDKRAVTLARANITRAGLDGIVHVERRELSELAPPPRATSGLVVTNPPYGERLGGGPMRARTADGEGGARSESGRSADSSAADPAATPDDPLAALYELLGERLRSDFTGWQAAVLVNDLELGKRLGLRAKRTNRFLNGALECTLLRFEVAPQWFGSPRAGATGAPPSAQVRGAGARRAPAPDAPLTDAAGQFANRLRKNARHLGRMMRRQGVSCYRVYDADLPDFAVAVDVYERWVHVQEYAAPAEIEPDRAAARLAEALRVIPDVLEVVPSEVFLKVRKRQRGSAQYERQAASGVFHEVHEGDFLFLVNFTDYLDTGLFPQGREVRRLLHDLARRQRFLNLFGYTGAASVAAAKGGAATTKTVDLSPHYLEWAQRNFALNKMKPGRNVTMTADCLSWVAETEGQYDLIYLDPPTFSNSKKMARATFDVQRDHADLIRLVCRRLLAPGGTLVFASNSRRFRMETAALEGLDLEDLSKKTLPRDYERSARTHNVWRITAQG